MGFFADNFRYHRSFMSTIPRGRLWMSLERLDEKEVVAPTPHNRLNQSLIAPNHRLTPHTHLSFYTISLFTLIPRFLF